MRQRSVFVLGDSIAFHYGEYLKRYLKDKYILLTKDGKEEAAENLDYPAGANGGDSRMVFNYIRDEYTKGKIKYDYFLFNCGLHDIKTDPATKMKQVNVTEYEKNLNEILGIMEKCHVKVLWMNTTPVDDFTHNSQVEHVKRYNADVLKYNAVAGEIMQSRKIPIIDLYSFSKKFGVGAYCDHVHYTAEVRALQAAYISGAVSAFINSCDA
mgnify:CR=1 FL=1